MAYLEEQVSADGTGCQLHIFDRETEVYHRQACLPELAAASDVARPMFAPSAETIYWYLPERVQPMVLTNPLR